MSKTPTNRKRELASNFIGFVVSRGLGTVIDTAVLWLCSTFLFKGYWGEYWISPAISFEAATLFNFVLSYYWIWKTRIETNNAKCFWHLFWIFNISCIAGFVVKMVFMLLFERLFGFDAVICNLLALCISGAFNFFLSEAVVFGKKKPQTVNSVITVDELAEMYPIFNSDSGRLLAKFLMDIFGVSRLNRLYDSASSYEGADCASKLIENMGCNYLIGNPEKLEVLPEGAFITISNHPYGGLDGLILADLFGHRRSDYKVMVNNILARVNTMRSVFITVTPTTTEKKAPDAITIKGIKEILSYLKDGHPLGCFPSGAVSDYKIKLNALQDREWQESMIHLIKRAHVPIVPVHFPDGNSRFYYFLGLVNWKIRLLRLPSEFFNKNKGRHRAIVGNAISVDEQDRHEDLDEYGQFLRSAVYGMPDPGSYVARDKYTF
jgi:putative hemolysin/putative flippase GtrA